jgi:anaerobic dimethyl sulfoxide reductase subunit A
MRIPAKVTKRIVRGVIAVSEGGWYKSGKDGADLGGSINVLTMSDKATPLANGNPQHTNLADVRLIKEITTPR